MSYFIQTPGTGLQTVLLHVSLSFQTGRSHCFSPSGPAPRAPQGGGRPPPTRRPRSGARCGSSPRCQVRQTRSAPPQLSGPSLRLPGSPRPFPRGAQRSSAARSSAERGGECSGGGSAGAERRGPRGGGAAQSRPCRVQRRSRAARRSRAERSRLGAGDTAQSPFLADGTNTSRFPYAVPLIFLFYFLCFRRPASGKLPR